VTTYWTVVAMVIGAALMTLLAIWYQLDPGRRRSDRRWVALGSSGAPGPVQRSWAASISLRRRAEAIDLTAAGATIADVRASQLGPALAAAPTIVVIWLGVSDLLGGTSLAAFQRDSMGVIAQFQRNGCQVVLLGLPRFRAEPHPSNRRRNGSLAGTVGQWRETIEAIGRLTGATLVDPDEQTPAGPVVRFNGSVAWFDEGYLIEAGRAVIPVLDRLLTVTAPPHRGREDWDEPADPVSRRRLGLPPVR
jgi:hypothetical protein